MPVYRPKHLMTIGSRVFQVPALKIAKSMGLKVVVTDYNPEQGKGMPVSTVLSSLDFG